MALSQISGTTGIADTTITSAKLADFSAAVDLNGVELLLDADQDTSITADTDDVIDFKIAGVEHISLSNSSGDTIIKPRVDAKDIIFQQFDGNKIFEINDSNFVGVGGNSTAAGAIRIYEDTDNGTHYSGFTVGNLTESVTYQLPNADGTSGQALVTNGSGVLTFSAVAANTPSSADGQALGSASLEWSDLFLADGGIIYFGADQDVTLTHNADTGLTLNTILAAAELDISGNIDVDGTTNLDVVDIDGAVQLDATLTVGANDQGYDIIIYGDTASANLTWDTSVDDLIFNGAARAVIPDGQLVLGSTAVTSTAAELNLLDDKDATFLAVPGKLEGTSFTGSLLIGHATTGTLNNSERNTGVGINALNSVTMADDNSAIGYDAGTALTTGWGNTALGKDSLRTLSTGNHNSAVGYDSGRLVTGNYNLTLGRQSGDNITSGDGNVIIGSVNAGSATGDRQLMITGYDGTNTTTWISGDSSGNLTFAANTTIGGNLIIGSATVTEAQLEILDGATITTTELNLIDGGATIGTTAVADGDGILHNDGGAMKVTSAATFKTYFQEGLSLAYDDFTIGDAAVLITTSSGNITIDAAANDSDIIFKGTDGGADRTYMTIDGSAGGDLFLTGGLIDLKNDGSAVSNIKFYCESSNAHAQTLIGAPHSESADNVLTLPGTGGDARLVSTASTATLTNKTLTSPVINTGTFGTSILPTSANGTTLGSASKEFADLFLSDGGQILFGADQDVTLTHVADVGLALKSIATADDKPVKLTLQTGETDMAANDVIGAVDFQAPNEGTGTDAILVAAGIEAVAEGDFSSSSNATSLVFKTGASEAAAGKIKVTSAGHLFPMADDSYDLGGSSNQWRNIYTGDLHLSNMSKTEGNIVDGTKGDWTIQEGSDELYLMNNNSGKKYKFNLTEV